jgi:hypothetical protein
VSYRLMFGAWAAAVVLTVFNLVRDWIGPGTWR